MIYFIFVNKSFDPAKKVGTLQIYTENSAYEFIGAGSSDGGMFKFVSGAKKIECHLDSNIRKGTVAILKSPSWGDLSLPTHPWKVGGKGDGLYIGANGVETHIEWFITESS